MRIRKLSDLFLNVQNGKIALVKMHKFQNCMIASYLVKMCSCAKECEDSGKQSLICSEEYKDQQRPSLSTEHNVSGLDCMEKQRTHNLNQIK